ncbi:hypothetical protein GCWU000342_02144 [Shuttleworthella satelles DSM 14600]|uniref:Uncharacterized protein n=1 Tax=Shuttleworthella satelles DSM 14600 TaxID=626523 RepID=C4GDH1_9FIRM|nr:hypothetical protein GCWU000342_02144 [Shuttleworthia satelles DSM 14600]
MLFCAKSLPSWVPRGRAFLLLGLNRFKKAVEGFSCEKNPQSPILGT